jgi:hypothetical protein
VIAIFNNNEKKAGKETKFDFERGRKNTTSSHILILPLILIEIIIPVIRVKTLLIKLLGA